MCVGIVKDILLYSYDTLVLKRMRKFFQSLYNSGGGPFNCIIKQILNLKLAVTSGLGLPCACLCFEGDQWLCYIKALISPVQVWSLFIIPHFGYLIFLALQQNLEILYQKAGTLSILLIFSKQFL